jgi:hypothetical protein
MLNFIPVGTFLHLSGIIVFLAAKLLIAISVWFQMYQL